MTDDTGGDVGTCNAGRCSLRARFIVVVNQIDPADLCGYRLDVTGGKLPAHSSTHLLDGERRHGELHLRGSGETTP